MRACRQDQRLPLELGRLVQGPITVARIPSLGAAEFQLLPPFSASLDGRCRARFDEVQRLLVATFGPSKEQVLASVYAGRRPREPDKRLTEGDRRHDACLVAGLWLGGRLVCGASLRLNLPGGEACRSRPHVQILFQATDERHQQHGLGRLLTSCILARAVEAGQEFATVVVGGRDVEGYWGKMGFRRLGASDPYTSHQVVEHSAKHAMSCPVWLTHLAEGGGAGAGAEQAAAAAAGGAPAKRARRLPAKEWAEQLVRGAAARAEQRYTVQTAVVRGAAARAEQRYAVQTAADASADADAGTAAAGAANVLTAIKVEQLLPDAAQYGADATLPAAETPAADAAAGEAGNSTRDRGWNRNATAAAPATTDSPERPAPGPAAAAARTTFPCAGDGVGLAGHGYTAASSGDGMGPAWPWQLEVKADPDGPSEGCDAAVPMEEDEAQPMPRLKPRKRLRPASQGAAPGQGGPTAVGGEGPIRRRVLPVLSVDVASLPDMAGRDSDADGGDAEPSAVCRSPRKGPTRKPASPMALAAMAARVVKVEPPSPRPAMTAAAAAAASPAVMSPPERSERRRRGIAMSDSESEGAVPTASLRQRSSEDEETRKVATVHQRALIGVTISGGEQRTQAAIATAAAMRSGWKRVARAARSPAAASGDTGNGVLAAGPAGVFSGAGMRTIAAVDNGSSIMESPKEIPEPAAQQRFGTAAQAGRAGDIESGAGAQNCRDGPAFPSAAIRGTVTAANAATTAAPAPANGRAAAAAPRRAATASGAGAERRPPAGSPRHRSATRHSLSSQQLLPLPEFLSVEAPGGAAGLHRALRPALQQAWSSAHDLVRSLNTQLELLTRLSEGGVQLNQMAQSPQGQPLQRQLEQGRSPGDPENHKRAAAAAALAWLRREGGRVRSGLAAGVPDLLGGVERSLAVLAGQELGEAAGRQGANGTEAAAAGAVAGAAGAGSEAKAGTGASGTAGEAARSKEDALQRSAAAVVTPGDALGDALPILPSVGSCSSAGTCSGAGAVAGGCEASCQQPVLAVVVAACGDGRGKVGASIGGGSGNGNWESTVELGGGADGEPPVQRKASGPSPAEGVACGDQHSERAKGGGVGGNGSDGSHACGGSSCAGAEKRAGIMDAGLVNRQGERAGGCGAHIAAAAGSSEVGTAAAAACRVGLAAEVVPCAGACEQPADSRPPEGDVGALDLQGASRRDSSDPRVPNPDGSQGPDAAGRDAAGRDAASSQPGASAARSGTEASAATGAAAPVAASWQGQLWGRGRAAARAMQQTRAEQRQGGDAVAGDAADGQPQEQPPGTLTSSSLRRGSSDGCGGGDAVTLNTLQPAPPPLGTIQNHQEPSGLSAAQQQSSSASHVTGPAAGVQAGANMAGYRMLAELLLRQQQVQQLLLHQQQQHQQQPWAQQGASQPRPQDQQAHQSRPEGGHGQPSAPHPSAFAGHPAGSSSQPSQGESRHTCMPAGPVVVPSSGPSEDVRRPDTELQTDELLLELQGEVRALQAQLADRDQQLARSKSERATLLRNISCLYATAKAEMARKDGWIRELRAGAAEAKQQEQQLQGSRRRDPQRQQEEQEQRRQPGGEGQKPQRKRPLSQSSQQDPEQSVAAFDQCPSQAPEQPEMVQEMSALSRVLQATAARAAEALVLPASAAGYGGQREAGQEPERMEVDADVASREVAGSAQCGQDAQAACEQQPSLPPDLRDRQGATAAETAPAGGDSEAAPAHREAVGRVVSPDERPPAAPQGTQHAGHVPLEAQQLSEPPCQDQAAEAAAPQALAQPQARSAPPQPPHEPLVAAPLAEATEPCEAPSQAPEQPQANPVLPQQPYAPPLQPAPQLQLQPQLRPQQPPQPQAPEPCAWPQLQAQPSQAETCREHEWPQAQPPPHHNALPPSQGQQQHRPQLPLQYDGSLPPAATAPGAYAQPYFPAERDGLPEPPAYGPPGQPFGPGPEPPQPQPLLLQGPPQQPSAPYPELHCPPHNLQHGHNTALQQHPAQPHPSQLYPHPQPQPQPFPPPQPPVYPDLATQSQTQQECGNHQQLQVAPQPQAVAHSHPAPYENPRPPALSQPPPQPCAPPPLQCLQPQQPQPHCAQPLTQQHTVPPPRPPAEPYPYTQPPPYPRQQQQQQQQQCIQAQPQHYAAQQQVQTRQLQEHPPASQPCPPPHLQHGWCAQQQQQQPQQQQPEHWQQAAPAPLPHQPGPPLHPPSGGHVQDRDGFCGAYPAGPPHCGLPPRPYQPPPPTHEPLRYSPPPCRAYSHEPEHFREYPWHPEPRLRPPLHRSDSGAYYPDDLAAAAPPLQPPPAQRQFLPPGDEPQERWRGHYPPPGAEPPPQNAYHQLYRYDYRQDLRRPRWEHPSREDPRFAPY